MKTCITTTVSGDYQWYIPLFIYAANKAYPEYDVKVFIVGNIHLPIKYLEELKEIEPVVYSSHCSPEKYPDYLRFIEDFNLLNNYDNVLITDVDIMIGKEYPDFVHTRTMSMNKNGLGCYDNYVSGGDRCPGVHFVTKDWWEKTEKARESAFESIINGDKHWEYDEQMLLWIIKESGLPYTEKPALWNEHGLHLGKYRKSNVTQITAQEQLQISSFLTDKEFMILAHLCGDHFKPISDIILKMKELVYL